MWNVKTKTDSYWVVEGENAPMNLYTQNAAIHSEPPIKEEKLFMSILPGSKKKIKEWEAQ